MGVSSKIISGYLTGLSVGIYCLGLCLPIFLPLLLSQKRTTKKSFLLVLEFSVGRLLGYLLFGIIFGWLGTLIISNYIHLIVALVNIWLGIAMILYSLGMINPKFCAAIPFKKIKWPALLGFLTGVNVCPPFLASITYVFNLKSIFLAFIYFLSFFLGTSTYIIPTAIFGFFSKATRMQKLAKISGIIAGLYFVVSNLIRVF